MIYVYDYAICSLLFLTGVTLHFFNKRQFKNLQNRLFAWVLVLALADILLDIASSLVIEHVSELPIWLIYLIMSAFYTLQIAFPALMVFYSLTVVGALGYRNFKKYLPLLSFAVPVELFLLINIFSPLFFDVVDKEYIRGPLWISMYVAAFIYTIITMFIALYYRKKIRFSYSLTILCFALFSGIAVLIQNFLPAYLLTSLAITLGVCMMFLNMNKPENMLDNLTGAFNYEALMLTLHDRIEDRRNFQIMLIKVDELRRINNLFGYTKGNEMLVGLVNFLMRHSDDHVFRLMSNQFIVITDAMDKFDNLQQTIKERMSKPWRINEITMSVSAKAVCMRSTKMISTPEELLRLLETMLPTVDQNSILLLDEVALNHVNRNNIIEEALLEALNNDALEVYYQPVFYCADNTFKSAEALVRFKHKTLGFIPPDEFIPIAEHNSQIFRVDELVMRHVCRFIHENDLSDQFGLKNIEINLSVAEFVQHQLSNRISNVIEQYGIDPHMMLFEITETATTNQFDLLATTMYSLTDKGCRFALDDYGTGYANIAKIMRLPFSCVKIDRSLLIASEESRESLIMLRYTIKMLKEMGFSIIVEGVETEEQRAAITDMGVDGIQGYYYARPMPEAEFLAFLKEHASKK